VNKPRVTLIARAAKLNNPRACKLILQQQMYLLSYNISRKIAKKLGIIVDANSEAQGVVTRQDILRRKIGNLPA
jgi:hypothetical protein